MTNCVREFVRVAALVALSAGVAGAQTVAGVSTEQPTAPPAPVKLKVGDAAPALAIGHWVKGDKVERFETGKAYVVEFWATWCAPCVQSIPHLTKLQKKNYDAGLRVIGISSADRRGVEDVRPFVEKQGARMTYTVAVDDNQQSAAAYMGGVEVSGIPTAFVVDTKGKLAWYGHPQGGLDQVVKLVLAGKFDAAAFKKHQDDLMAIGAKIDEAIQAKSWDKAEKLLDEVKALDEDSALDADLWRMSLRYMYQQDKPAAIALGKTLTEGSLKDDPERLSQMAYMIAQDSAAPADAKDLALKAAQRTVEIDKDEPARSYSILADVHKARGEIDKAIAAQEQSVAAAPDPQARKWLQDKLDQLKSQKQASGGTADSKPQPQP